MRPKVHQGANHLEPRKTSRRSPRALRKAPPRQSGSPSRFQCTQNLRPASRCGQVQHPCSDWNHGGAGDQFFTYETQCSGKRSWVPLGTPWGVFGGLSRASWTIFGLYPAVLGPSEGPPGPSWAATRQPGSLQDALTGLQEGPVTAQDGQPSDGARGLKDGLKTMKKTISPPRAPRRHPIYLQYVIICCSPTGLAIGFTET